MRLSHPSVFVVPAWWKQPLGSPQASLVFGEVADFRMLSDPGMGFLISAPHLDLGFSVWVQTLSLVSPTPAMTLGGA